MEFREHALPNGLEIVAECNPQAYSTALGFFVRAGSRDENDANNGVSHFLEHMMFKGTPTRSAADVNRELDEIGSMSNAFTSEEQTVYFASFLPEYRQPALELLADILRPSLREEDFDMEKKVILEEIAKYEDQPPFGAHEKCMTAYFGAHPLGRTILGSARSVGDLTRGQMLDYFRQRYSPGNIVLAAAGNLDFRALVKQAELCCGDWEPFDAPRQTPPAEPKHGFRVLWKESAFQQYLVQIAPGPAVNDDDRYAARLLATVLGDESGSRMFWEFIDTGLAESVGMWAYEYQGTGIFMTYLACQPDDTEENLLRLEAIYRQAESDGIDEDELVQAKSKVVSHLVLQAERPANRLFNVGNNWLQRREYKTLRETIERYERVTCDEIASVLSKYRLSQHTTVAIGPRKDVRGVAAETAPSPKPLS